MSKFFRSYTMKQYNLMVPRESVWDVMNELGCLNQLHFVDYNPQLPMINRPFANYIRRCEDTLNKINYIIAELKKYNKKLEPCNDVGFLIEYFQNTLKARQKPGHTFYQEIEEEIEQKHKFVSTQAENIEKLQDRLNSCIEQRAILEKCNVMMGKNFFGKDQMDSTGFGVRFNQLVGVIDKDDEQRLKRMIFRVTKGNAFVQCLDIENGILDSKDLKPKARCVYLIVFQGGDSQSFLQKKMQRIQESFGGQSYESPSSQADLQRKLKDIDVQYQEASKLFTLTTIQIDQFLNDFSQINKNSNCSYIEQLRLYVIREKYLYTNLNYLMMQNSIFTGTFWLPEGQDRQVEQALRSIKTHQDSIPFGQIQEVDNPNTQPPTYFKVNEITWPFQEIVNTYGVPRYQEVNPGLFTVVTFPFLFGVMFGDIGHGLLLLLMGAYLCLFNHDIQQSPDSSFKILLKARHMFLLMGFFAMYNGFIYNEYLSISLDLFGSCYELEQEEWKYHHNTGECVYPFGIDPAWGAAENQLTFVNSYKMKLSVIIAVIHMTFGIILKGVNNLHFKNYLDFFFEFVPQLIFMICTFGWMDYLIFYKWTQAWQSTEDPDGRPRPPSIITVMINMVLNPFGEIPVEAQLFENTQLQLQISATLLTIAVLCVPTMLYVKPYVLKYRMNKHKVQDALDVDSPKKFLLGGQDIDHATSEDTESFNKDLAKVAKNAENSSIIIRQSNTHNNNNQHQHEEFSEIFVHQVIETIEFVLGSVSNTASYLRLWALSLAHGQLAEVFFAMALSGGLKSGGAGGGISVIFAYPIFAMITFAVLMLMDVMECFLHALRLHWVEFQNKFYKADGYVFVPFSFENMYQNIEST